MGRNDLYYQESIAVPPVFQVGMERLVAMATAQAYQKDPQQSLEYAEELIRIASEARSAYPTPKHRGQIHHFADSCLRIINLTMNGIEVRPHPDTTMDLTPLRPRVAKIAFGEDSDTNAYQIYYWDRNPAIRQRLCLRTARLMLTFAAPALPEPMNEEAVQVMVENLQGLGAIIKPSSP